MIQYQVDTEIWVPFAAINGLDRTSGVSGLANTEITFRYGYADGTTGWTTKALDPADLKEKASSDGDYIIRLTAGENASKGVLMYACTEAGSADFLPYKGAVQIVAHDPEEDIANLVTAIGAGVITTLVNALQVDVTTLRKLLDNNWKIDQSANTHIFYEDDGVTPFRTFALTDSQGNPTTAQPYERKKT